MNFQVDFTKVSRRFYFSELPLTLQQVSRPGCEPGFINQTILNVMTHLKFALLCLFCLGPFIGCKKDSELPTYENKFTLFEQPDSKGNKTEYEIATKLVENELRSTHNDGMKDAASSVSFSLAPGIVVYLYENEDGTGKRLRCEGVGSVNLADEGMGNIISAVQFQVE